MDGKHVKYYYTLYSFRSSAVPPQPFTYWQGTTQEFVPLLWILYRPKQMLWLLPQGAYVGIFVYRNIQYPNILYSPGGDMNGWWYVRNYAFCNQAITLNSCSNNAHHTNSDTCILFLHIDLYMSWRTVQSRSLLIITTITTTRTISSKGQLPRTVLPPPSLAYSLSAPHPQLSFWLFYHNHYYPRLDLYTVYCLVSKGSAYYSINVCWRKSDTCEESGWMGLWGRVMRSEKYLLTGVMNSGRNESYQHLQSRPRNIRHKWWYCFVTHFGEPVTPTTSPTSF